MSLQAALSGKSAETESSRYALAKAVESDNRYSKVSNDGSLLSSSANLGSGAADWACTRDNKTGLIWEIKTTSGLRSMNHTYSWSDRSNPNRNKGRFSAGNCEPIGRCDIEKFVQDVNAAGLCRQYDWRVPSIVEFKTLANSSSNLQKENRRYFPNSKGSPVWGGRSDANNLSNFSGAYAAYEYSTNYYDSNAQLSVRLVRGGK